MPLIFRIFFSLIIVFYLSFLAWLALLPASYFSPGLFIFEGADKVVHCAIYSVLAFLLFMLFIDINPKTLLPKYAAIFILASVYGLLMEFLQLWIRNASRSFEIGDVIANCAGVLCGILFGYSISPFLVKLLIAKPGAKKSSQS